MAWEIGKPGDRVLYYTRDYEPGQVLNFKDASEGIFHLWGTYNGDTIAVVQDGGGRCHHVPVPFIRFINVS